MSEAMRERRKNRPADAHTEKQGSGGPFALMGRHQWPGNSEHLLP